VIQIVNLTKRYGKLEAVSNLNLHIKPGEFFGFLGPNGAGKTTTIKIITGVLRPTKGKVLVGGYDIQQQSIKAKQLIGYIPDRPTIYEKLTGREFLRFIARLYNKNSAHTNTRIEELLDLFDLTEMGDELVESYSHGMRQKLVMSAAFIHDPKVIVVDEPMVGLDPKSASLVKGILKEMCRRGMSVFMSTHTLEIAEQMCDRIGIIQKGKLIALGTLDELYEQAKTSENKLEDLFLQLTGGPEMSKLIEYLERN